MAISCVWSRLDVTLVKFDEGVNCRQRRWISGLSDRMTRSHSTGCIYLYVPYTFQETRSSLQKSIPQNLHDPFLILFSTVEPWLNKLVVDSVKHAVKVWAYPETLLSWVFRDQIQLFTGCCCIAAALLSAACNNATTCPENDDTKPTLSQLKVVCPCSVIQSTLCIFVYQ